MEKMPCEFHYLLEFSLFYLISIVCSYLLVLDVPSVVVIMAIDCGFVDFRA